MNYYFAPMEGITGYCFRQVHHRYFPGVHAYYMPFVGANRTKNFSGREKRDIDPANNAGIPVIPQVLTSNADAFVWAVGELEERGYGEVNLNLGCPASTVVSHHRGAGMLEDPERLDRFFDESFRELERRGMKARVSVKSRIGLLDPAEFPALMDVFVRYPLSKLILHPRLREEYYQGEPRREAFAYAADRLRSREKNGSGRDTARPGLSAEPRIPLVWNGEVRSPADAERIAAAFPGIGGIMIGRGLLINPMLGTALAGGALPDDSRFRQVLRSFHRDLIEAYRRELSGETPVLFKMKELLYWLGQGFEDGERYVMKARHAKNMIEYKSTAEAMFREAKRRSPDA